MIINRNKAKKEFEEYVEKYNSSNDKIKLKIFHTYKVTEICEKIAISLKLSSSDIDIAWLLGLLHDIGRFEQVKRYGTFNDSISIDHAKLGVNILFDEGKIRDFIEDDSEDELIKTAIAVHNQFEISEDLSERTTMFCNILRDADKVDIFRATNEIPMEKIYNITKEELMNSGITKAVLDNVCEKRTLLRSLKRTGADIIAGQISLVFGLVYDESLKITKEQGNLEELMNFKSNNNDTMKDLKKIKEIVNEYLSRME